MAVSTEQVLNALKGVEDPDLKRDLVSLGFIQHVVVQGDRVAFTIELTTPACPVRDQMKEQAREAVRAIPGVAQVDVTMTSRVRPSSSMQAASRLAPTVKHIIPIASGKGGVGKSTVSANIALALAQSGARVGLMDADVYGPSIPTMLGVTSFPEVDQSHRIHPVEQSQLKLISMGFFMKPEEAVIWRGPMLHKTVEQFLGSVQWGELDYLLVDLPPGCLTAGTLVPTDHGVLPIHKVQEGFLVYSFDGHFNKVGARSPRELHAALVRRRVSRVIPQGEAQVWELRTKTRSIRGTADHPVLVVRRHSVAGSRYQTDTFEWQELAHIQPGDVIVAVKKLPQDQGVPLSLPSVSANGKGRIRLPDVSSEGLIRLVGYFLGDGTLRMAANGAYWGVWFSEPANGRYRPQYIRLLKDVFGFTHVHEQPHKFAGLSSQVAELFDKLGLKQHVLEKTIPLWVFSLPETQKLALIEGYCDADGHRRGAREGYRRSGGMSFESPNQPLLEGLRAFCMDVGLKTGNLTSRTRQIRLPSTGRVATSTCYGFEANRAARTNRYGAGLIRGPRTGQGLQHEYVGFERVKAVRLIGREEVYDLQVEEQHNFVANGFIVHNTGDVQLSLCQLIPITGAVIVSTPQDVALNVAQKAIAMFKKLNAPILGIIENMSAYVCSHCGAREEIFGVGGARRLAQQLDIPFLGEIPLATAVRQTSDAGTPIVLSQPDSPAAKAFVAAAEALAAQVSIRAMQGESTPQIKVTF